MNILFSPNLIAIFRAIYLWILGISIGAIIACGAFSAPCIFGAQNLGVEISKFQSGIIMTAIFLKLNNFLLFSAFFIAFFEVLSFKISARKQIQKIVLFLSGAISVICILLFALYYSPYIVSQQELGPEFTSSSAFNSMHSQSEAVFHILFLALSLNFLYRVILYAKGQK